MNIALILSGGSGTRLGSAIPKQYIEVNGRMLISYCLESFMINSRIDCLWVVAEESWQDSIVSEYMRLLQLYQESPAGASNCMLSDSCTNSDGYMDSDGYLVSGSCTNSDIHMVSNGRGMSRRIGFSTPGATRQLSILNGLEDICNKFGRDNTVIIHDAARPNLSVEYVNRCLDSLKGHDGVMPALPMKDTVYLSEDGKCVSSLIDRSKVYAGQAPELYKLGKYLDACKALLPEKIMSINGSTEPAILAGLDVAIIPGDENNYKITSAADMDRFIASSNRR